MHSRFVRFAAVLIVVLGSSAHAQLSFNLPRVTGFNAYYDPAILWIQGGHTKNLAYSFGIEASFTIGLVPKRLAFKTQFDCRILDKGVLQQPGEVSKNHYLGVTRDGEECRICYVENGATIGRDAWGEKCDVDEPAPLRYPSDKTYLDLAVGYGQTGTYGSTPLLELTLDGQNVQATGLMRTAPYISFNVNKNHFYGGVSLGLITLSAQTFLPPITTAAGTVTPNLAISGITLAPSLHVGYALDQHIFAELGCELRHFNAVDYRVTPSSVQLPSTVPLSMSFYNAFLRLGTWWTIQD